MDSSGELWVLNKIVELSTRFGVDPIIADIYMKRHSTEEDGVYYTLGGVDGTAGTPDETEKQQKIWSLLGLNEVGFGRFGSLYELNDVVDRALSLAPRSRIRQ